MMEEEDIKTLDDLYGFYGFNHLLGGLDTLLMRRWAEMKDDPVCKPSADQILKEVDRLKKAWIP